MIPAYRCQEEEIDGALSDDSAPSLHFFTFEDDAVKEY